MIASTPPGRPKSFDQTVQDIASAAHRRGVFLTRGENVVGSVEARALCRALRAAYANTANDEQRQRSQVLNIANGIAGKLVAKGPVLVAQSTWNVLRSYARVPAESKKLSPA